MSLASDRYLADWVIIYLIGGLVFVLVGLVCGWSIWRNYRNAAEKAEKENREAKVQLENANDRASRLKAQLREPSAESGQIDI